MTCAERPRAALLALALLLAACSGTSEGEPPLPRAVQPARGVALQPTPVRIEGEGFDPVVVRRLSGSEPLEVDTTFRVRLGDVALEGVVWRDAGHLEAVVPAGLAPGLYPLTVEGPLGAQGTLEAAFEVVAEPFARLAVSATLGRDALAPGEETQLVATLQNTGSAPLREPSASLEVAGAGQVELRAEDGGGGQTELAPGARTTRSWRVRAQEPGQVRLTVQARGVDAESGLALQASSAPAALRVLAPAALTAALALEPATANVGSDVAVLLTLTNTGERPALDVQPLAPTFSGQAQLTLRSGPDAAGFSLAPGAQRTVRFVVRALSAGSAQVRGGASARDASSGETITAPQVSAPLEVLQPAQLTGTFVLPASVSVGQDFPVHLDVLNAGGSAALGLQPQASLASGMGTLQLPGTAPAAQDVPGGETRRFSWTVRALAAGRPTLRMTGSAQDATSAAAVPLAAGPSAELPVQLPAALGASLGAPASVNLGDTFEVLLTVRNTGGALATGVSASALALSAPGLTTTLSAPPDAAVSLAAGASTTFLWTLRADAAGSAGFSASASGRDANSAAAVAAPTAGAGPTRLGRVRELAVDPFADGTDFSFLASFGGRLLLGPSKSGSGAVAMNPDGTGAQSLAFSLPRDPGNGASTDNNLAAPYPSIGSTGCAKDTYACGPDNEDGRGVFFSGTGAGTEFLGVAGGRSAGDWNYVYLTRETGSPLRFSFVDLRNAPPGPATRGISSAHFANGQLYLGLPDNGGNRPYFLRLRTFPSGTGGGLDAVQGTDALNLELDRAPGFGENGTPRNPAGTVGVDAIRDFGGLLYVANNGAWLRATVADPRSYLAAPGDWARITPSAPAYAAHASVELPRSADLEPSDKAVPFFAVLQGRLYAARNTTAGPQLWVCTPTAGACDAGSWSLLAPNTTGTPTLSQFNAAGNTRVTLLAASAARLYVGFNNVGGAVLFRSKGSAPAAMADFEGEGGCVAGSTGCAGLGGNGLGVGVQRLYDSALLGSAGRDFLYVTAGSSGAPVRVLRISEEG